MYWKLKCRFSKLCNSLLLEVLSIINLIFIPILIVVTELNSTYYTATLWQFDLSIQCLVMTTRLIATHLMFSWEVSWYTSSKFCISDHVSFWNLSYISAFVQVRRSFQDPSVCTNLNFWKHVQKNVGLILKHYQNKLMPSGTYSLEAVAICASWVTGQNSFGLKLHIFVTMAHTLFSFF